MPKPKKLLDKSFGGGKFYLWPELTNFTQLRLAVKRNSFEDSGSSLSALRNIAVLLALSVAIVVPAYACPWYELPPETTCIGSLCCTVTYTYSTGCGADCALTVATCNDNTSDAHGDCGPR